MINLCKKYENKNILCFIKSANDNIFGGYSEIGWKTTPADHSVVYNYDENAFIFSIRSSIDYKPIISDIKHNLAGNATRSQSDYYLMFGTAPVIYIHKNGQIYHVAPHCYYTLPTPAHLTGGVFAQRVTDIEIFQLR